MSKQATLVDAANAAVSITSVAYDLGDLKSCSIHVDFTGSDLAGSLKLQASNDNSDWVDVGNSTQSVTSATSHLWNITSAEYRYIRPVWTASSGSGNITVVLYAKENFIRGV